MSKAAQVEVGSGLAELADRCEAAEGADEQLERDIAAQLYGPVYTGVPRNVPTQNDTLFPRYTASLDAAMTLVPEGHDFELFRGAGYSTVQIGDRMLRLRAEAATPALALCAAALRARAAMEDVPND